MDVSAYVIVSFSIFSWSKSWTSRDNVVNCFRSRFTGSAGVVVGDFIDVFLGLADLCHYASSFWSVTLQPLVADQAAL